jgi:GTPase SAR1 family protein
MGICASEEEKLDDRVSKHIIRAHQSANEVYKLLLLGTGESGKSTFFKQIACSYGSGFNREFRLGTISAIHSQIIKSVKTLANLVEQLNFQLPQDIERSRKFMIEFDPMESVSTDAAHHILKLWESPDIKRILADKVNVEYELPDSTEYFLNQLSTVLDPLYVPSNADLFRVRIPTTGIQETEFIVKGVKFLLVDVGGQRNERRKWINCFDNVNAVLYFVAISEYDQVLYEDSAVNRMRESMDMFKKIANEYFPSHSIILFFNKMDKLQEKVKSVDVAKYFDKFSGPKGDADAVFEFFKSVFLELNDNKQRTIYSFPSCATDTKIVKKIFDSIKDTIIRQQLESSALL